MPIISENPARNTADELTPWSLGRCAVRLPLVRVFWQCNQQRRERSESRRTTSEPTRAAPTQALALSMSCRASAARSFPTTTPSQLTSWRFRNSTYSNPAPSSTLQFIVDQLNSVYPNAAYAYDLVVDPTDGNTSGNGPSGLIYNTKTVTDLGAAVSGTASSSGAPRAPNALLAATGRLDSVQPVLSLREPCQIGNDFVRRQPPQHRNDRDSRRRRWLGGAAHVIYTGDFNINGSSESSYQTLISSSLNGGVGKAFDPANPAGDWTDSSAFIGLISETATRLQFRDDMQLMTAPTLNDASGLMLIAGSEMVFANNGSVPLNSAINSGRTRPTRPCPIEQPSSTP